MKKKKETPKKKVTERNELLMSKRNLKFCSKVILNTSKILLSIFKNGNNFSKGIELSFANRNPEFMEEYKELEFVTLNCLLFIIKNTKIREKAENTFNKIWKLGGYDKNPEDINNAETNFIFAKLKTNKDYKLISNKLKEISEDICEILEELK